MGYCAWFPIDLWAKILIGLFLILPITVFTVYVYEPLSIKQWRSFAKGVSMQANATSDLPGSTPAQLTTATGANGKDRQATAADAFREASEALQTASQSSTANLTHDVDAA